MRSNPGCTLARCPDENEIMAMTMGLLSDDEVKQLEQTLDQCAFCAELVAALAQDLKPSEDPLAPGEKRPTRIGKYEIKGLLGVGGMGMIYEAIDRDLQRPVALKLLRPDVVDATRRKAHTDRLLREAQLLASLRHPHIPTVYEVGTWHEQIYLAIQLIDGVNMRQWLADREAPWWEVVGLFCQAGDALIAAHDADIIHRDIKPDNIMVSQRPDSPAQAEAAVDVGPASQVWLTDFGLARWVQSSYHSTSVVEDLEPLLLGQTQGLTDFGELLGTPAYMAPEQYKGQGVSRRSDQFSFCVSLYEALYGMRPFEGRNMDELATSAQRGDMYEPFNSKVPRSIFAILSRGMHPLPRERYPSMEALLTALRSELQRGSRPLDLGRLVRQSAVVFGLLAFGGGGFWLGRVTAVQPAVTQPSPRPSPIAKRTARSPKTTVPPKSRQSPPTAPTTRSPKRALTEQALSNNKGLPVSSKSSLLKLLRGNGKSGKFTRRGSGRTSGKRSRRNIRVKKQRSEIKFSKFRKKLPLPPRRRLRPSRRK